MKLLRTEIVSDIIKIEAWASSRGSEPWLKAVSDSTERESNHSLSKLFAILIFYTNRFSLYKNA